ncbi:MAG: PEP-CTERM sorting domain-containing protein, partial [Gemmataceae bacterium]
AAPATSAVPEPSSLVLLLTTLPAGFLILAWSARRRRRQSA